MNLTVIFVFFYAALFSFSAQAQEKTCKHLATKFRCVEVAGVYDGDSLKVNIPNLHPFFGEEIGVRVSDIDTAEKYGNKPCEREMADLARNFIHHRLSLAQDIHSVELREVKKDKYFRINAQLWVNGYNIGSALAREGLAVAYDGGTKPNTDWCQLKEKLSNFVLGLEPAPAYK